MHWCSAQLALSLAMLLSSRVPSPKPLVWHMLTAPLLYLGVAVPAVFVSPSLIAQTDASVEEALRNSSWLDVATVLPPSLGASDVGQLLGNCAEITRDTEHKKGQVCGALASGWCTRKCKQLCSC